MCATQNRGIVVLTALFGLVAFVVTENPASAYSTHGETKFKENCAACHANGGNIIKGDKTLFRKDREKNGIRSAKDIIKTMRKPGPGMTMFDKKAVSDKEDAAIAEYIQKTYR